MLWRLKAKRLERAMAKRLDASGGHDFKRQTAFEIMGVKFVDERFLAPTSSVTKVVYSSRVKGQLI
jgi:hypothetical protein